MNAVGEGCVVWDDMDFAPFDGGICFECVADELDFFGGCCGVGSEFAVFVAAVAGFDWGDICSPGFFDIGVAVAAVHTEFSGVGLVVKAGAWLGGHVADFPEFGRGVVPHACDYGDDCCVDTDDEQCGYAVHPLWKDWFHSLAPMSSNETREDARACGRKPNPL